MVLPYFESSGLEHYNGIKPFIEYSYDPNDIYKNIDENSPNKKCKTLIVFDDMIADMLCFRILNPNQQNYLLEVKKTRHFSCFHQLILFCCTKKY